MWLALLCLCRRRACGQETMRAQWGHDTGPCRHGDCLQDTLPWTRTAEYVQLRVLIAELQTIHRYCESQSWRIDGLKSDNRRLTSRVRHLEAAVVDIEATVADVQETCEQPAATPLHDVTSPRGGLGSHATETGHDATREKKTAASEVLFATYSARAQRNTQLRHGHAIKRLTREARKQREMAEDVRRKSRNQMETLRTRLAASAAEVDDLSAELRRLKVTTDAMSKVVDLLLKDNSKTAAQCASCKSHVDN